ncbi:MAG: lytic transglycosylase domain-containing protein [Verrucomicrobia bacterium]|nr:lytic transglycosylase domain-containing protein [Verrucomicrobiota bacterium]
MNCIRATLFSLLVGLALRAEEAPPLPGTTVESVRNWISENIDDWAFELANIDRQTLNGALQALQVEMDAAVRERPAPCRADAEQVVRALREFEPTRPCAAWLHAFLDQVETANAATNAVTLAPARPSPRELFVYWLAVMTNRPAPAVAGEYLAQLKPIFLAERVPAELVWVAEIESAFNPQAKSPVGAVGLFQLMPDTAQSLGLSTWFPDERCDAEKNARAAARYLQHLHDRFGEWRLALAAYNAGPTRVSKLLKKSEIYSYEAIAHQLPDETQAYVARVEATLAVREGVDLPSLAARRG